jgi:hypothetical protein
MQDTSRDALMVLAELGAKNSSAQCYTGHFKLNFDSQPGKHSDARVIRRRKRTSTDQLDVLEVAFQKNPLPDQMERIFISQQVSMNPRAVQVWFQNRRAKEKRLQVRKANHERLNIACVPYSLPFAPSGSNSSSPVLSSYAVMGSSHSTPSSSSESEPAPVHTWEKMRLSSLLN